MNWDALTDREKNLVMATRLFGLRVWSNLPRPLMIGDDGCVGVLQDYATDRNEFVWVEQELQERGVWDAYTKGLNAYAPVVILYAKDDTTFDEPTAPLAIRCKAALRAIGVEVG